MVNEVVFNTFTKPMNEQRNAQLDNVKALLIFLVVAGHCYEFYMAKSQALAAITTFIYSFHMPLFVFVSGYLSKNLSKVRDRAFIDLFILYLIFNSGYYILESVLRHKFIFSVFKPGWTLWYLLSLFIWRILLKDLVNTRFILPISIILFLIVGCFKDVDTYFSLSRTISFLPFFLLGYFATEDHIQKVNKIPIAVPLVVLPSLAIWYYFIDTSFDLKLFMHHSKPYDAFELRFRMGILYKIMSFLLAIVTSVLVYRIAPRKQFSMTRLGASTLFIYLLHPYLVRVLYKFIPLTSESSVAIMLILIAPFIITGILSIPQLERAFNYIIQKTKSTVLKVV